MLCSAPATADSTSCFGGAAAPSGQLNTMCVYGFFSFRPRALTPARAFSAGASAVRPCMARVINSVSVAGMPRQAVHATRAAVVGRGFFAVGWS